MVPRGVASSGVGRAEAGGHPLASLRAVVLLAGTVRPTQFMRAIGRSVLGLPLDDRKSVLENWRDHVDDLANQVVGRPVTVRVMVGKTSPRPPHVDSGALTRFEYETDPGEFRGTGGLLSDIAQHYADHEYLFIANGGQLLLEPLSRLVEHLAFVGGDACIVAHEDGTPSGLMMIRCGCLRSIPRIGFVDLKEQALPQIAKRHVVKVARRARPTGMSMRTLDGYVASLREHHRRAMGEEGGHDPFGEDWKPTFSLVEPGARVDDTATVHDSVVLSGATVLAGAVLVRSVVCPGGVVMRKQMVVDQSVGPAEASRSAA